MGGQTLKVKQIFSLAGIFGPLDAPSEGQCSLALRADSSIIILLAEEMLGLGAEELEMCSIS